ncbi:diacylglycerol/lipid kinase family protein [Nocardioides sp.]|uniref:diacylglycerol/lipid kinase family protein n=1 Tax=Nocardioides sp. TaxID=35761 RepID=UPI002C321101|nr:YegS/Rv2252/BmrU family lipid kinase [Nocardioides sp.]HSX66842.1 YegS/Rv2252/BmrU family lipid kinase [Nocardioides sp.]
MSFSFLVNPTSGGGSAADVVAPVARILRDAGAVVEVTRSPGPQQTDAIVGAAVERGDVFVSAGGDGMLSSIAGAVARRGGTLGIIPAGRGNDFARMLALPKAPDALAEVLLRGVPTAIDLLSLRLGDDDPRMVAGSVYSGVDAVAGEVVDKVRWMPRKLQYPYAAVHSLATYKPVRVRVAVDGEIHSFQAATVVVANSKYYGSGMKIAPSAEVDDGLLDVVVIEAASRRGLMRSLPKVYDGSHVDHPEVHVLRGRSVTVYGNPPVPMGGDGEPLGQLPASEQEAARIEIVPQALNVLLPAREVLQDSGGPES